jgi:hypothetical protein
MPSGVATYAGRPAMVNDHTVNHDVEADRLDIALQHLVADARLTGAEADTVRAEFAAVKPTPERQPWTAVLPEVGGYVGAAFVVAAALVLAIPRWDDFGHSGQVAILGIPALVFIGAALVVALSTPGGWSVHARAGLGARRRLVSVLLAIGIAAAVGAVVVITAPGPADLAAPTTAAILAVAGYVFCRTPLLHLAALGFLAATSSVWLNWAIPTVLGDRWVPGGREVIGPEMAIGLSFTVIAAVWGLLAIKGVLDERHLGLVSAGALFFVGAEMLATDTATERAWANGAGYILLGLLAVAGLVGYVRTRYVGVLAVGVIALATVVPQAVIDYTDGALGAAGALLLIGLSIVGASLVGVRLRSTSRQKDRPDPGVEVRADLR